MTDTLEQYPLRAFLWTVWALVVPVLAISLGMRFNHLPIAVAYSIVHLLFTMEFAFDDPPQDNWTITMHLFSLLVQLVVFNGLATLLLSTFLIALNMPL